MTDSDPATTTPAATAATTSSQSPARGCEDCGWPFGPDLCLTWVLGRQRVLCKNPWKCRSNQADEAEYLERILN